MAIWNCTEDTNGLAALLKSALPEVRTDLEMMKLEPAKLRDLAASADSMTDCLLAQQSALADLLANADIPNLSKNTFRDAGWLLRQLTDLHEVVRRIADTAHAYAGPDREFHQAMVNRDAAALTRLTQ